MRGRPEKPELRFWEKVDIRGPDDCWLWTAYRTKQGYGWFRTTTNVKAHRFAYQLATGVLLHPKAVVMHTCDNPPCCNPTHLVVGTQRENMRSCLAKGRANHRIGEDHPLAKLTNAQVEEIRSTYRARSYGYEKLAVMFGVSSGHIGAIVRGENRTR